MSNLRIDIKGVNFEESNITFVNGLTMEKVRLHYQWLLNTKVKDAIIGEDEYGIVWYFGDWYCGEWFDGTWYSGNFYNGTWDNGRWFSYKLHKFDVVNEKFIIEEKSKEYSVFHNGLWRSGEWHDGIFGENAIEVWYNFSKFDELNTNYNTVSVPVFKTFKEDFDSYVQWKPNTNEFLTYFILSSRKSRGYFNIDEIIKLEDYDILDGYYKINEILYDSNDDIEALCFSVDEPDKINEIHKYVEDEYCYGDYKILKLHSEDSLDSNLNSIYIEETKNVATWLNGNWKNGLFQNAIWNDGIFENGLFFNSKWIIGRFYDGVFDGDTWYSGEWMNGDFIRGKWMNGIFTKLKSDKISRFGASRNNILETVCEWFDGEWKNGEWFSGYKIVDNYQLSLNNKLSIWYDGIWRNGTWYGGHFKAGNWFNGVWKDGLFGDIKNTDFIEASSVYENINNDDFIYENKTFDGFGSFWSNDSGELYRDIIAGDTPATNDSLVKQDYIEVNHNTNIGGWYTGGTSKYYYSGATEELGKITLYIRDNFNQIEYDQKQLIDKKRYDYTYELSLPHIIEIGGSGFTASSVTHIDDENNQLYYFVESESFQIFQIGVGFVLITLNKYFRVYGGYTKVVINEYDVNLVDKINNFSDINIKTKEKVKYEEGNGSGRTFLPFDSVIKNSQSNLEILTSIQPADILYPQTGCCQTTETYNENDFCINDDKEIYIEIDSNNTTYNSILNQVHTVSEIFYDSGDNLYHITTKTNIQNSINISGNIVDNLYYKNRLYNSNPQHILFQEFNHNLNITNNEEVLGVQVRYITNYNKTSKKGNLIDYDTILPFKNLFFKEFDFGGNPDYDINIDYDNYDNYLNIFNYPVNGKKIQNITLTTNNEQIVGSINDIWNLENLIEYYPIASGYDPDDYNIKKIINVLNNIRISKSFQVYGSIVDDFNIEKIEIKLFYKDNNIVWYNGTFEKGLWLNGSFENGKMISSLIISGDYHNGYFGYEPDDNRAIR